MNLAYIFYNKRSCVTGKKLFDFLSANNIGGFSWRRSNKSDPKKSPSLVIRWGNSLIGDNYDMEINSSDAVNNAADKEKMMIMLNTSDVSIPPVTFMDEGDTLAQSNVFVRDRNDHVRYVREGEEFRSGDKYFTESIDKVMELRVHIFDGRCIGIYEKMPESSGQMIYKNENCRFRRVDISDENQRRTIIGARPLAKEAVNTLGLVFGGVDVVKDRDGNWYVLEVNSSPSLNEPNIERWCNSIGQYIDKIKEDV